MGLFKKKRGGEELPDLSQLPEIPKLPKLPELPRISEEAEKFPAVTKKSELELPKLLEIPFKAKELKGLPPLKSLPSFPSSKIGESLSQKAVKFAIIKPKKPAIERLTFEMPAKPAAEKLAFEMPAKEPKFPWQLSPLTPPTFAPSSPPSFAPLTPPSFSTAQPQTTPMTYAQKIPKKIEPVYIRIDKFKFAITSFEEIQHKISEIDKLLKGIREQKRKEEDELTEWEREIEMIKARIEAIDRNVFSKVE